MCTPNTMKNPVIYYATLSELKYSSDSVCVNFLLSSYLSVTISHYFIHVGHHFMKHNANVH